MVSSYCVWCHQCIPDVTGWTDTKVYEGKLVTIAAFLTIWNFYNNSGLQGFVFPFSNVFSDFFSALL